MTELCEGSIELMFGAGVCISLGFDGHKERMMLKLLALFLRIWSFGGLPKIGEVNDGRLIIVMLSLHRCDYFDIKFIINQTYI